jgi:hypothetical protein
MLFKDVYASIWIKMKQNVDKFILVPNLCLRFGKLEKNEKQKGGLDWTPSKLICPWPPPNDASFQTSPNLVGSESLKHMTTTK